MKTVVQELIDDLLSGKITDTLAKADYYKEKHKQQIIDALHYFGIEDAEKYYSKTFKKD